jgi:SAM-dependent methyltransferase
MPCVIKLNLGCGRDIRDGWVNVDQYERPGVDLAINLDDPRVRFPLGDNTVSDIHAAHLIEHLRNPLGLMQELWRLAAPGCTMTVRTPHGGSDDAWGDPTHVRPMFPESFHYYGQPVYWRADYGYKGDWRIEELDLIVRAEVLDIPEADLHAAVTFSRNMVHEMVATLVAVKPARPQDRALLTAPMVRIVRQK